jgi:raffinose/stachyose/melibiose transport system permease protein
LPWPLLLLATLRLGFYDTSASGVTTGGTSFAGWSNYATILFDAQWSGVFWNAMWNNAKFFLIHMLVQNPVALLLVTLFSIKGLKGERTYRTLIFLPTMLSVVIIGFIWQLILSPLWGVGESLMTGVGLGDWFAPGLGHESAALLTIALISIWKYIGIPMLLIFAALLAVPEDIVEAGHAEGAGALRIFWHIKLALI